MSQHNQSLDVTLASLDATIASLDATLASIVPTVSRDEYVFVSVPRARDELDAIAMLRENDSVSYVMTVEAAQRAGLSGTFRCHRIDLGVDTAWAQVGLMARLPADLALHEIAVNPIAGYHRDHLFVPVDRANDAAKALSRAADRARIAVARDFDREHAGGLLIELAPDLWIGNGTTVPFFGMPYPTRMTVIRLSDGGLFIHSPIKLSAAIEAEVLALGEPRHLIAPNRLHHLFMTEWAQRFPAATIYAASGVAAKLPGLTVTTLNSDAPLSWRDDIDQLTFAGSRVMEEVVFFHRSSHTLVVADLIENLDPATLNTWQRILARAAGILAPRGSMPRDWLISFFGRGRSIARSCAQQILAWRPQRVVLAHGHIVETGAASFLANALRPFE